jgi:leucine dehydrogenase
VFEQLAVHRHEQVSYWYEPQSGYRGVIAIHNTALGPALGGTRFWHYVSDAEALNDVLRLSRGMTYKSAVAGLNLGGGKSVIIGDPSIDGKQREAVFRTHGRHVESLAGRYITAEDVNTSPHDMEAVFAETQQVVGLGPLGEPSPVRQSGHPGVPKFHIKTSAGRPWPCRAWATWATTSASTCTRRARSSS